MLNTHLMWFRRDLRVADNPALCAALRGADKLVCLYLHSPEDEAPWEPGAASNWWLHRSLAALDQQLRGVGQRLMIRSGPARVAIPALLAELGINRIDWNRLYEPALVRRDSALKKSLRAQGIAAHSHNAALVNEPWEIETGEGRPYRVFSPYWRNAQRALGQIQVLDAPETLPPPVEASGLELDALRLLPSIRWDTGFDCWAPGEQGAWQRAERFLAQAVTRYGERRDLPADEGTSGLSAALHFGEIGPRQLLQRLLGSRNGEVPDEVEHWVRELGWREFSYHLLYHFPDSTDRALQPMWRDFPWQADSEVDLEAWQQGLTGIPIVDAGMRQLWHTGWMHNRVRMIVASLLTKNLGAHWLHGARWFWDTLVDADLASNTQGWQWAAGTGADAAPYFRIFNPVAQSERFDTEGDYIRRWVPELAKFPEKAIHAPWDKEPERARLSGYAKPIVDLKCSRAQALERYRNWKA